MSTEFINDQWRLPNEENKSKVSNYSMDFDTSSTHIEFATIQLNTTKSVSFWVNWNTTITGVMLGGGSGNYYPQIHQTSGVTRFYVRDTGGVDYYTYNSLLNTNQWYHVCITGNGTTAKVYLDGSLIGTMTDYTPPLKYINTENGSQYGMIGKLDAVCIFDYELSSSQITTLYGSSSTGIGNPMSLSPKPVAYYPLGDQDAFNGANYLVPNIAAQEADGDIAASYSPYALDFDGTNDYIDCGDSDDFSFGDGSTDSPFSVSAWVNPDAVEYAGIVAKYVTGGWEWLLYLLDNNFLKFLLLNNNTSGNSIGLTTDVAIPINTWTHVSATYNANGEPNGIDLYINGSLQSLVTESTSGTYQAMTNTTAPLQIGTWNGNFRPINGQISNVSIWDVKLTPTQVSEIYNEGVPQNLLNHSAVSSLVSWWQLGSNSSFNTNWTVLDEKGSNNGTSVNMTEDDIVDGVGSYANGLSSGMGGDEVIGDAPYSSSNALSVNMDVEDRVTDTPS